MSVPSLAGGPALAMLITGLTGQAQKAAMTLQGLNLSAVQNVIQKESHTYSAA